MEPRTVADADLLISHGISKRFGGVQALDNVSFDLRPGEVHALVGENGAGKSTYIKILCGLYQRDAGDIYFCGETFSCEDATEARRLGIGLVPQIIELAEDLTVGENIFMGLYPRKKSGLVDWKVLFDKAYEIAKLFNMQDLVRKPVRGLSTGHRQMIEILKSLVLDTKIIAFDEPTAALSQDETRALFKIIEGLKEQGIGIIFVSHRLEELFQIANRITVLKDGKYMGSRPIEETDKKTIVSMMVGRDIDLFGTDRRTKNPINEVIFEAKHISYERMVDDVSFTIRKNEILGMFGMVGSGRTETVLSIFGALPKVGGEIFLNGRELDIKSPSEAVGNGIGLVPEDRIDQGLIMSAPIRNNMTLPFIRRLKKWGVIAGKLEENVTSKYVKELNIKTPSDLSDVQTLSGGNQQKVSIAKWLATGSDVIFFDEPTHGIDVGAKHDIYQLLRELSEEGIGVVMISSELPEIINVCDRILVFRDGVIVKDFNNTNEITESDVVQYALG